MTRQVRATSAAILAALCTMGPTAVPEFRPDGSDRVERWYVVRDLGTALGSTAKVTPIRGNPDVFERLGFIKGVRHGFVDFVYDGRHQHLVDDCITTADVRWASSLMAGLTREQWHDAFRAGGDTPAVSERFITRLLEKMREGLEIGETATTR